MSAFATYYCLCHRYSCRRSKITYWILEKGSDLAALTFGLNTAEIAVTVSPNVSECIHYGGAFYLVLLQQHKCLANYGQLQNETYQWKKI